MEPNTTTTAVALSSTSKVPDLLKVLADQLASLKKIETTAFKCPSSLEGVGNIQTEMKVENLIRAMGSVVAREQAYQAGVEKLGLKTVPVFNLNGGSVEDWRHDIDLRIQIITQAEKTKELTDLQNELNQLLDKEDRKAILFGKMEAMFAVKS